MEEAEIPSPPSRRTLALLTGSAAFAGLVFLLIGVLPAEYHKDPTGLGRLTGIDRLWAPAEVVVSTDNRAVPAAALTGLGPLRSHVIEIPLGSGDDPEGSDVEYKVRMRKGASYVYSWSVDKVADPEEFYTEFHGHTTASGKPMTVAYYRTATGVADSGVLTAPFDGVHGWYFQNQSVPPVKVRLKLTGFYDLIPDGQPGNEAGLHARAVE